MSEDKCKKGYGEHDYSVVNNITKTINCVNCGKARMSEDKTLYEILDDYTLIPIEEVDSKLEAYYRKKFVNEAVICTQKYSYELGYKEAKEKFANEIEKLRKPAESFYMCEEGGDCVADITNADVFCTRIANGLKKEGCDKYIKCENESERFYNQVIDDVKQVLQLDKKATWKEVVK